MARALIAFAACAGLGILSGFKLMRRAAVLNAWLQALECMKIHCAYTRETPFEVFRAASAYAPVLSRMADAAECEGVCWTEEMLSGEQLSREARTLLTACLQTIADGSQEEQALQLQFSLERMKQLYQAAVTRRDRDARLYMSLGVLGGLCCFLIFW